MAHHRWLVITLVIVFVMAVVGIGVLASATNDTDEPVQDEVSSPFLNAGRGLSDAGAASDEQSQDPIRVPVVSTAPRLDLEVRNTTCARVTPQRTSDNTIALRVDPLRRCNRAAVRYAATVLGARTSDAPLQALATLDLRGDGQDEFPSTGRSSCTALDVPGGVITRCGYAGGRVTVEVYY